VPLSLWSVVLSTSVEVAPDEMIPLLVKRVASEKESRLARPIYQALARAPDAKSYDAVIAMLLGGTAVNADMLGVLRRPWQIDLQGRLFDFIRDHWDDLIARTPEDFRGTYAPFVCDPKRRDELVAFLKAKLQPLPDYGALRTNQMIENIDRCIAENAALAPAVAQWLK